MNDAMKAVINTIAGGAAEASVWGIVGNIGIAATGVATGLLLASSSRSAKVTPVFCCAAK